MADRAVFSGAVVVGFPNDIGGGEEHDESDTAPIRERLERVDDHRLFTVFEALKSGVSVEEIHAITKIDNWFLCKLRNLAEFEGCLAKEGLTAENYETGKKFGYPDAALLRLSGGSSLPDAPKAAVYKMVDTCAAEFDAETPYFYSSFDKACESRAFPRSGKPVIMAGSAAVSSRAKRLKRNLP